MPDETLPPEENSLKEERSADNYPLTGGESAQPAEQNSPAEEGAAEDITSTPVPASEASVHDETPVLSRRLRFKRWYGAHKKWTIPATIILIIAAVAGVPWSRYETAGLVMKNDLSLQVLDSKTSSPVSGALISIGSISGTTDGSGDVTLQSVKVGYHTATVTKKYYQDQNISVLVPIMKAKNSAKVSFVATGRPVKVVVKDTISGKPLSGVNIKIADTEAKTNDDGSATVVVPADSTSEDATLSLSGYNDSSVTVAVSADSVKENDFTLTPAGRVYFLSRRTGKLNVMKANLDGSDPKVVLAGTGYERDEDSGILTSGDGKYVALLLKRSATDNGTQLYVLSTNSDSLMTADSGNYNFTVFGWAGDNLVYEADSNTLKPGDPGQSQLKSYDATSGKGLLLDKTAGSVDSTGLASYEYYQQILVASDTVAYAKDWIFEGGVQDKQDTLNTISPNGQNHKTVATYSTKSYDFVNYQQHGPTDLYIWTGTYDNSSSDKFYDYSIGGQTQPSNIGSGQFYRNYPTYYLSPSGEQALWAENRDGKNTILIGDSSGDNSKVVATLDDYSPVGWFTSKYVLLTKKDSQLYILSTGGGNPVKITDYQPTQGI